MQQCKGIPGQGSRRGLIVEQGEGDGLGDLGGTEKGKSFEM